MTLQRSLWEVFRSLGCWCCGWGALWSTGAPGTGRCISQEAVGDQVGPRVSEDL